MRILVVTLLASLLLLWPAPEPVRGGRAASEAATDPMALYALHCSPCHGERGRGDGPAGRFFDPPPRDFTRGAFRLVSTENRVASDKDLFEVIAAGVPGTAMLPFAHLPHDQLWSIIGVLRQFHRQGQDAALKDAVEDPEERAAIVAEETTPGPPVAIGDQVPDTMDSRFRGRLHYRRLCASCHGTEGRGDAMPPNVTDEGHPIRPRDLTRGVLKGGTEPVKLFQRIRLGLPGTPMPAVSRAALDDSGVWDLVNYLGALIPAGAQPLHDPVSWTIRVPKLEGASPTTPDDPRFAAAPETHIAFAPFRANEATVPSVSLRLLHDGTHLVVRAEYPDPTGDRPGPQHPEPPDGFAVRLSGQNRPPVLPIPGLPLPLDRALWLAGRLPDGDDPIYDGTKPRFTNPDRVCVAPVGPELVGKGSWENGVWTVLMLVKPERAGEITSGGDMPVSFSVFDGSLRRGPMPVAFTNWHTLRFE